MTPFSPLRVVICEDQPVIRKDLQLLMREHSSFAIAGTCGSVKDASLLIPVVQPDLLILDIALSDGTGFDILKKVSPYTFHLIFLTAFKEHAIQAIKMGADDYLLKPIDAEELKEALDKILKAHIPVPELAAGNNIHSNHDLNSKIILSSQQYLQLVTLSDIVYCESDGGYTTFYLSDERKVLTSKTIKEYEYTLHEPSFLRPHQSFLVNSNYIDRYRKEDSFLVLKNGKEIPVSVRRKDLLIEYFNKL